MLDEFLGLKVDTSRITWVFTANDISRLPALLRSRLTCFALKPPTEDMLLEIVAKLLGGIARQLASRQRCCQQWRQRTG